MKDKGILNFKSINRYYVRQRENELKKLEVRKDELLKDIDTEQGSLEENKKNLERVKSDNLQLHSEYECLINVLINKGLMLDIENLGYQIKEWDNLNLIKRKETYIITTKKEEELYSLDKDTGVILSDIFNRGYDYSIIVIRAGVRYIKVQLRFVK